MEDDYSAYRVRSWYERKLKPSWYNRYGLFKNGIKWFRLGDRGPGLWWMDMRVPAQQRQHDVVGIKVGHWRVKPLWPQRH